VPPSQTGDDDAQDAGKTKDHEDFWNEIGEDSEEPPQEKAEVPEPQAVPEVNGTAGTGTEVAADTAPEIPVGPDPALKAKEEEEAQAETDPLQPRVLQLSPEDKKILMSSGQEQLSLLKHCCEADIVVEDKELKMSSERPFVARTAELAARGLLASNTGAPVLLRVLPVAEGNGMDVADLPGASMLDVPGTGGVEPKELRRFGNVVAAFLRAKDQESLKSQKPSMTSVQADLSRQLDLSIGQAVEVRYDHQWFHATVVSFTEHGTVMADYFRVDGSLPDCEGGEIEAGAVDVRAAQTPRPKIRVDSGKLILIGERKARMCARLHAAAQAERRAVATGNANPLYRQGEQTMAEEMLGMPEDGQVPEEEEMGVAVCSFELPPETATGPGLQRLNQAASVTDTVLEVLPGGRKAILCGDFEERQRARALLELLPKVGHYGDIASIPIELQDLTSHLRVPNAAMQAVREKQKDIEMETGSLMLWLPSGSVAPNRQTEHLIPNGAYVEAQYRGAWHNATVVYSSEQSIQISWEYDGSLDEVEPDQVREKDTSNAARAAWLRSHRVMVVLGQEKQRLECLLRVMVASEKPCPGLWSSDDALEEAQIEVLDGHDETDCTYSLEITPLASLDLDSAWFAGPGCVAFAAAERAIPCAMQILGRKLMLAGTEDERSHAKEYLSWAQLSRKGFEHSTVGLRGGGQLDVTDADMRDDVLPALLPEDQAVWITLERIAEIQRETRTFLVFDQGGGSSLETGMRRLLVAGGDDVRRMQAAARVRETQSGLQQVSQPRSDPLAVLSTMSWPQNINEWGRLQKTIWAGHPKLKPGWIRIMSKTKQQEYYMRVADKQSTFDLNQVILT